MSDLIGQRGLLDINDVDVVGSEPELAKRGGGIMYLVFQNSIHGVKDELERVYFKKIDGSLWLGSGIYAEVRSRHLIC